MPPISVRQERHARSEVLAIEAARLDRVLAFLILVLAFLLASFVVRNTDFWMHLATGRLVAHGQYAFGTDPFSYTSTGPWINHSWLYDVVLYGFVSLLGGPENPVCGTVLVILKGLLITLLAWLMLQIRRPAPSTWAPAACTALALLALSPRLLLQPSCLSFLFLGLTLYLLTQRPDATTPDRTHPPRRRFSPRWLLLPLFVVWVNVDNWFLLGPLTVGLYWLGELLQQALAPVRTGLDAPEPGELRSLGVLFLTGLAVCLLNPYHVRAFMLPPELYSPALDLLHAKDERLFVFFSPLNADYLLSPGQGMNPAGLAYYVLLVLGLLSFILDRRDWRGWRATIWLCFALLSLDHSRAIPFFAVVAGPITALNLQDYVARRFGIALRPERGWRFWSLGGRIATVLAAVALLLAAWPGWLNANPEQQRFSHRVGWEIEVDPSLKRAAEQLATWHGDGRLHESEHGFIAYPDTANYFAWYCPDEQGFFDYRFQLFPNVAGAYAEVRLALRGIAAKGAGTPGASTGGPTTAWQKVFREHGIDRIVLNDNDSAAPEIRKRLLADHHQWPLLYLDGRTTIFAWKDPRQGTPSPVLRVGTFDAHPLAFGRDLSTAERAPGTGPERPAQRPTLWTLYWRSPAPRPLAADTSIAYLEYFHLVSQRWAGPYLAAGQFSSWLGAVGSAGIGGGSVLLPVRVLFQSRLPDPVTALGMQDKGQGPPAALLLAIRAARRAIAASPDNPQGYFGLAHAYQVLWREEEERWNTRQRGQIGLWQTLRHVQTVTALRQSLLLKPDAEDTYFLLFELLQQIQHADLAIDYLRDGIRLRSMAGPRSQELESRDDFEQRRKAMEGRLKEMESELRRRDSQYEVSAANKPLGAKVQIALELGLAKKALTLLMEADPTQISPSEADTQLNLLLMTGRVEDVRERLDETLREYLQGISYQWYNLLLAAATGDYELAGKYADEIVGRFERESGQLALALLRGAAFQGGVGPLTFAGLGNITGHLRSLADFRTLRGMLALEEGDNATATELFRQALQIGLPGAESATATDNQGPRFDFDARPIAARYLRELSHAAP